MAPLYRLSQLMLAPGAGGEVRRLVREVEGGAFYGPWLDVGSGPLSMLGKAGAEPVCVDLRFDYVAAARRNGALAVLASAAALPFPCAAFQSVWCFGLLHHLSDNEARQVIREMIRVARPGGLAAVFDAVKPVQPWRRPLAALIRRLDRGGWMRSRQDLESLLPPHPDWQVSRLTYSYTGLEAALCTLRLPKAGAACQ